MKFQRSFVQKLKATLAKNTKLIQVVLGPRQIGKTTGIKQLLENLKKETYKYESADGIISKNPDWLFKVWTEAKTNSKCNLLVIDEIQKVENWPNALKQIWDAQQFNDEGSFLDLIILGSSSLNITSGLTESLAGRYLVHNVYHWDFKESRNAFNLTLEDYLMYGGYPASYQFIDDKNLWLKYIRESIITPVVGKDILSQAQVKSPALFKQCFDLICSYPAQEISYNKLLGQLQQSGNIEVVKYYLNLLNSSFLVRQLYKYSKNQIRKKSSSPKLLPLTPALYSQTMDVSYDSEKRGRAFELVIGTILNQLPGSLYYWRDGKHEVDFIYEYQDKVHAIEVKSGRKRNLSGLLKFKEMYKHVNSYVVTPENFIDTFDSF